MSYDGYFKFNNVEIVNMSRTAQLAEALGIDTVWKDADEVAWIDGSFSLHPPYDDIANAPWYDAGYPASGEFAGVVPLSVQGLDDSTLQSNPVEYITDGGNPGRSRNSTVSLVWSVAIIASTDRGAEYGKRWLDRMLRGGSSGVSQFCSGSYLSYFRYEQAGSPLVYRRDVKLTRGTSVINKRVNSCSSTWRVTFTMTAGDPYEYGAGVNVIHDLGNPSGSISPYIASSGSLVLTQEDCPVYDYSPIYDPLYPALVAAPSAPDFLPEGWGIVSGETFERFWVRLNPFEPVDLNVVPTFLVNSSGDSRWVRLSVWSGLDANDVQCDPLFSAIISYLPDGSMYIDGVERASYVYSGGGAVRRTDSLVYGPDAVPIEWTSFNDQDGLLVTLDQFYQGSGVFEGGVVSASLTLTPRSD